MGRLRRPLPRRLRARHPGGPSEDDRLRAAVGKTPPGAAKPSDFVLLRVGAALGDPRKRPFTRCFARARAGLLRKRPKVCALIQQGAADPCFVALTICIAPGRWRVCFRGAATPKLKRILLAFSDAGGLNARPQSFAVRNKRKTLRFAACASTSVPGELLCPCGFRPTIRMGPRSLASLTHLRAPRSHGSRSTPSRGLPAQAPPQTAPRGGWGCRRRRWRSGDTWGRSRRARGSRSLPGS